MKQRASILISKQKFKTDGGEGGEGNDPTPQNDPKPNDPPQGGDDGKGAKPSETEAKLLQEVMKRKGSEQALKTEVTELKASLAKFDGIDLEQVQALLREKAEAETNKLVERGEFDRVRQQMVEQHQQEVARLTGESTTQLTKLQTDLAAAQNAITDLTIGRNFSDSSFVRDSLTLTPAKARVVYGSQFELKDGKVVAYDKPAGASDRTLLVDGTGNPLPFDLAIEKIVKADPDHEHLIRSKVKPGANSKNDPGAKETVKVGSGRDRISAAVAGGALKLPA